MQSSDDGIFWIRLEDFIKFYQGIGILEIIPGAISNAVLVANAQGKRQVARVQLKQKTHIMFSIDQQDSRIVDNPNYSYSYFRFTIGKLTKGGLEFVDSNVSPERNIFLEENLEAGDYLVLVEPYFSSNLANSYSIGTYSDHTATLQLLPIDEKQYDMAECMIWKDYFKKNMSKPQMKLSQRKTIKNGNNTADFTTHQFQSQKFAFVLYGLSNLSNGLAIHQDYKVVQNTGFNVQAENKSGNLIQMIINPKDSEVLLYKMDPRSEAFNLSHQIQAEELIQPLSQDKKILELTQAIGGVQPTPDKPNPDLISKTQQQQQE